MRILIVGAGAVGGYFGGRLLQVGRGVTFLVRAGRAAELARDGLVVKSPHGDFTISQPPTVVAEDLGKSFDVVVLSCKAYDLDGVVEAVAPAVGPETMILPLLNGMKHLDDLDDRFGRVHVLGGQCQIAATLNDERAVVQMNPRHLISFGERDGGLSDRITALAAVMSDAGFDAEPSETIVHDMWEKWIFLSALASGTCLLRGTVGDIETASGGSDLMRALLKETGAVAQAAGYAPRAAFLDRMGPMLTAPGSSFSASMLRDLEGNARIEADHVIGDLLERRQALGLSTAGPSLVQVAYTHLKTYEARRGREFGSALRT
jgi:2-dehydropantoate 2-reductase